jgi:putative addiction module component (TIGR02574 family)
MNRLISLEDLMQLRPAERLLLALDSCEQLVDCVHVLELTDAQRRELELRLAAYHEGGSAVMPWEEVRARVFGR